MSYYQHTEVELMDMIIRKNELMDHHNMDLDIKASKKQSNCKQSSPQDREKHTYFFVAKIMNQEDKYSHKIE